MANHLFDGLMANAQLDHVFARMPDGRSYTYQDVLDVSARFANRLVELGVKPGDRVAVQVPKSIEAVRLYLGTVRAAQGLDIVDSKPFFCPGPGVDFLKSVVGGSDYDYLRYSRGVLLDLLPAESGNVLFWLNQQPHPDIRYESVIRQTAFASGDELVPAYSQDMNNIPSLRGRVEVFVTPASHSLNPQDGALLAGILEN